MTYSSCLSVSFELHIQYINSTHGQTRERHLLTRNVKWRKMWTCFKESFCATRYTLIEEQLNYKIHIRSKTVWKGVELETRFCMCWVSSIFNVPTVELLLNVIVFFFFLILEYLPIKGLFVIFMKQYGNSWLRMSIITESMPYMTY